MRSRHLLRGSGARQTDPAPRLWRAARGRHTLPACSRDPVRLCRRVVNQRTTSRVLAMNRRDLSPPGCCPRKAGAYASSIEHSCTCKTHAINAHVKHMQSMQIGTWDGMGIVARRVQPYPTRTGQISETQRALQRRARQPSTQNACRRGSNARGGDS